MKISTRGRYALKMMVEFAINMETPTKINQVSKSYGISEKYLVDNISLKDLVTDELDIRRRERELLDK